MNKILNSEVKNFKEWCCGKELQNDYLCGDFFNKITKFICDDCLDKLTVRKSKIKSIRNEIFDIKKGFVLSKVAMDIGQKKMLDSLENKIEELKNGRD